MSAKPKMDAAGARSQDDQAVEDEQAFLGLVLANRRAAVEAFADCQPALLIDRFHRRIFECAKEMHLASENITCQSLRAKMESDPAWDQMPGDYLVRLSALAPAKRTIRSLLGAMRANLLRRPADQVERKIFLPRSMASLKSLVSPAYLVKRLIAPGELSVIYGEPGSGKSFLASWIGYNVSLERPIFGRRTHGAAVLYVALEGQVGFERRLRVLRERYGESDRFSWITQSADLFAGTGDTEGLVEAILRADAKLLVIDTFARAMGAGSENEGRDMGIMIGELDLIRRETGAHISMVHHCGKDSSKGMRGHSSLMAAADVALETKRDGDQRTVRVVKSKDGMDGDEYGFALEVFDLGPDEDGDPITSCVVRETGATTKTAPGATLTKDERGWLKDLTALFEEPGAAVFLPPASTMHAVPVLTRDQVRDGLKRKGRIDVNVDGQLTGTARTMLSRTLNRLKDKGKIVMTDKYVWLCEERQ